MMDHFIATSVAEFRKIVSGITTFDQKWYRGHSLSTYSLLPSLFREQRFHSDFAGRVGDEYKSFMRGKHGVYQIQDETIGDRVMQELYADPKLTYAQRMYKNQHNGVPTRLMDFTTNELAALFFCVENSKYWNPAHDRILVEDMFNLGKNHLLDEAGAIYVVDPIHINKHSILLNEIVSSDDDVSALEGIDTPYAIEPPIVDARIKAQSGKFIYFGFRFDELDTYFPFLERMIKILIPNKYKPEILEELIGLGVSHKTIYPDFEGYAKYAKYLMEKEFRNRKQES